MEEHGVPDAPIDDGMRLDLPGAAWPDGRWLTLLVLLVLGMRIWQVHGTEVASRDSIAYTRYAWRLENEPWLHVIAHSEHHPGYPFAVYLAAKPIRLLLPDDRPRAMQLSAQLVSCLASLLLVFPMFYLGRELFDARVGFWATLLFQCLPGPGRVFADGLSDPLFLFFAAASLWMVMIALRTGKPGWFALVGLTSALAYLTRTEGALLTPMTGLVLLGLQASPRWRRPWPQVGRAGVGLIAAMALLSAPFMVLIGGVTLKPSWKYFQHPSAWKKPPPVAMSSEPSRMVVTAMPLGMWNFGWNVKPGDRWGWAAWALLAELDKGFFHYLGLPTLLGLFLFRRRFHEVPGAWVLLGCGVVLLLLVYRLGQSNGYLGERHVLLIVMGGVYFTVAALASFGAWLARFLARWSPGWTAARLSLVILVVVMLSPLSRTLSRLHGDRKGFKDAGLWLAKHLQASDHLRDPFAWASYYAGRTFRSEDPEMPPDPPPPGVYYVVLEESTNLHPHLYYLLGPARQLVEKNKGEAVGRFPQPNRKQGAAVVVYRVRIDPSRS